MNYDEEIKSFGIFIDSFKNALMSSKSEFTVDFDTESISRLSKDDTLESDFIIIEKSNGVPKSSADSQRGQLASSNRSSLQNMQLERF